MFCDIFNKNQALTILEGKKIWFIGSSNLRAIYKDLLWLITHESIAPLTSFKIKNEPNYLNDIRTSNDILHNGRDYKETRIFKSDNINLMFHFITRLYLDHFIDLINSITPETCPDVILLNSCIWDLTRWGPEGPTTYKENILHTFKFLKSKLPITTRVIWKTGLPVSISADGALFTEEIQYMIPMLPWHILEANVYAAACCNFYNYDILDFHHHMLMHGNLRVKDGIHWQPLAVRYMSNIFLTHLCLIWGRQLPGHFLPLEIYLRETSKVIAKDPKMEVRVKNKAELFKKLLAKGGKIIKRGANKILTASRNIFKRKPKTYGRKIKAVANNYEYRQYYFQGNDVCYTINRRFDTDYFD